MPLVKIELKKGKSHETLNKIMKTVSDTVVDVLKLPGDDRNIRLFEYEDDFFRPKPPYEILIEITLFKGRSKEIKKILFQSIVKELELKCNMQKQNVFILLNEQPHRNNFV